MQKINCNVNNCSHNNSGTCYANRVDIGGKSAQKDCDTCCGSFLDEKNYGDLTNNTNNPGECDCLVCNVETCTHNCNKLCNLSSINVNGANPNMYTETNCKSFSCKVS
ncbi:DUF1540 domain-containing protein [Clostridium uliginosum]|uniref:DUF1540 domain-containing protein n=1 Tax=Clostridium uliginosum TaxID=119641 RepID=A0A1I1PUN9_9CLOT|nr:DUF1540 domain-containing protein [Clostridium uliginosum]SFD13654.1 protein of unknown function [Clostridium uliginosum]